MKRLNMHMLLAVCACLMIARGATGAEPAMGTSHGYDLDTLWSKAQASFDVDAHDAVLLLEREHVTVLPGGGRRILVHRVVRIGTAVGIRAHADLRIPWDSAVSTMRVLRLRTWQGGRWWPGPDTVGPTAVVETLPFSAASADDYTTMRETMLLHDGVELPCIMETAYEIEETGEQGRGYDGRFVFRRADPAVLLEYALSVPAGTNVPLFVSDDTPGPETTEENGMSTSRWRVEHAPRLGSPRIAEPAIEAPYLLWSTWKDWTVLGRHVTAAFDEAAALGDALADSVRARTGHVPGDAAKARAAAELVGEWTRPVDIGLRLAGTSPRPARRTYETAYGHPLDRAALAAAVFRAAGLDAQLVCLCAGAPEGEDRIPGISRFAEIRVSVIGDQITALYDPVAGGLHPGYGALTGKTFWIPSSGGMPRSAQHAPVVSPLEVVAALEPGDEGVWRGAGYLRAAEALAPYGEMAGTGGEARSHLERLAGSVLPGAEVGDYSFEQFDPARVTAGFEFDLPAGETDGQGCERIVIGDPAGGIVSTLPGDLRLYHEHRTSPVVIPAAMVETVTLRVKTGGREVAGAPSPVVMENEAGRFSIEVEQKDGRLTVTRTLSVESGTLAPEKWPLLRELLLEYKGAAGRTVALR